MQWILQEFDDTLKLAEALDRLNISYSWHKVVPFAGELIPEPVIRDPNDVVMFGSYALWRYAQARGLRPGVFKLDPFIKQQAWLPHMLNGPDARLIDLQDLPRDLAGDDRDWFVRPVDDSKQIAGRVMASQEIVDMANGVIALERQEIPDGSLRHDTQMMLSTPMRIMKEWRVWVVDDAIVTFSLYKEGARVIYRPEIDDDAREFVRHLVDLNPGYSKAYVIDVCRTDEGLKLIETNCINAAGFYAANLLELAHAIDTLNPD